MSNKKTNTNLAQRLDYDVFLSNYFKLNLNVFNTLQTNSQRPFQKLFQRTYDKIQLLAQHKIYLYRFILRKFAPLNKKLK